jgi:Carboxypeptidase regulatory-like domain
MHRSRFALTVMLSMVLLLVPCAWAQENATIVGTVVDASNAVVPNAEITLTNTATSQVRTATSNTSGIYLFANVGVGQFTLSAMAKGFQKYVKTDITVNTAQTLKEDITLTVGSESQTVTVEADALVLQSETNEVSNLISGAQVTQLATNGRNVVSLAALGMGVSNNLPAFGGVNALTSANGISFNGTRVNHNIYLLDGGELNDRGCGGCFSSLPSVDALAQFQTLDSNYGPDYGIGSGGTILMVLKSGTSSFHGGLWEFNRNADYNANNYFSNLAGQQRSKFDLNVFGGNIGGPLWIPHVYNESRSRTFFFVNEEWRKLIQGSAPAVKNTIAANNFPVAGQDLAYTVPSNGVVPIVPVTTDPAKLAIYATRGLTPGQPFPGNIIPKQLFDPNAVLEMNAGTFPKPNFGTSQYISSIPQPTDVREDVVRIDHAINSKLQLMGHYLHDSVSQTYYPPLWGDSTYPTVGTAMLNPSWSSTIKLTQTLSPNLLNETAFLYSGNTIHLSPVGVSAQPSGWTATSFFPVANNVGSRMPEIQLGAPYSTTWSSSYFPWKNSYEGYETRDDLSWNKGVHQFKFGFSWLHAPKNQQLQANTQGTAVFNNSSFSNDSYINFLLGDAASFTQLQFLAGKHWVQNNYGGYANDNWHVIPRLTLNLGLRYDALPHTYERFNQFANFVAADYNTSLAYPLNTDGTLNPGSLTQFNGSPFYLNGMREAGVNGFPRGVVQNYYYTFQPRVGFAYNLPGKGATVLRGGFGMFYERVQGNDVYNAAQNPPFAYQPSATNVYFSNPNTSASTGLTTTQAFPSTLTNIQYQYKPPGTAQFSLGIQRELSPSVIGVFQYVGTLGWTQNNDRAINTLPLNDLVHRQGVAGQIPNPAKPGTNLPSLNANLYRQFPGFSSIQQEENESNFNFNALEIGIRMENKHGLTFQMAYTYSHEIDSQSNDLGAVSNPFNIAYDYGSGALDRRQIFNVNYIYEFPFFAKSGNTFEKIALGGWELSGVTFVQSGVPQSINYNGADTLGLGGGTANRPNKVAGITYPKTRLAWFNKASFAAPLAPWNGGTNQGWGNAGKDQIILPGLFNFNMALFKTFSFTESLKFQFRLETFNTFNHTEFNGIDNGFNDGNFGQVTSAYDPRVLQLGGKLSF